MSEDELGEALRAKMQALTEDLTPSAELIRRVDAIPDGKRSGWRRLMPRRLRPRIFVVVPVPVAALAVLAVIVFGGSDTKLSYGSAMTVLPNGEIRVTIQELMDPKVANADLRRHHIHGFVVVPMAASCSKSNLSYFGGLLKPPPIIYLPRTVPGGGTTVLAAKKIGSNLYETASGRFRAHVPTCVSSHGTGPGLGNWEPTKANRSKSKP